MKQISRQKGPIGTGPTEQSLIQGTRLDIESQKGRGLLTLY